MKSVKLLLVLLLTIASHDIVLANPTFKLLPAFPNGVNVRPGYDYSCEQPSYLWQAYDWLGADYFTNVANLESSATSLKNTMNSRVQASNFTDPTSTISAGIQNLYVLFFYTYDKVKTNYYYQNYPTGNTKCPLIPQWADALIKDYNEVTLPKMNDIMQPILDYAKTQNALNKPDEVDKAIFVAKAITNLVGRRDPNNGTTYPDAFQKPFKDMYTQINALRLSPLCSVANAQSLMDKYNSSTALFNTSKTDYNALANEYDDTKITPFIKNLYANIQTIYINVRDANNVINSQPDCRDVLLQGNTTVTNAGSIAEMTTAYQTLMSYGVQLAKDKTKKMIDDVNTALQTAQASPDDFNIATSSSRTIYGAYTFLQKIYSAYQYTAYPSITYQVNSVLTNSILEASSLIMNNINGMMPAYYAIGDIVRAASDNSNSILQKILPKKTEAENAVNAATAASPLKLSDLITAKTTAENNLTFANDLLKTLTQEASQKAQIDTAMGQLRAAVTAVNNSIGLYAGGIRDQISAKAKSITDPGTQSASLEAAKMALDQANTAKSLNDVALIEKNIIALQTKANADFAEIMNMKKGFDPIIAEYVAPKVMPDNVKAVLDEADQIVQNLASIVDTKSTATTNPPLAANSFKQYLANLQDAKARVEQEFMDSLSEASNNIVTIAQKITNSAPGATPGLLEDAKALFNDAIKANSTVAIDSAIAAITSKRDSATTEFNNITKIVTDVQASVNAAYPVATDVPLPIKGILSNQTNNKNAIEKLVSTTLVTPQLPMNSFKQYLDDLNKLKVTQASAATLAQLDADITKAMTNINASFDKITSTPNKVQVKGYIETAKDKLTALSKTPSVQELDDATAFITAQKTKAEAESPVLNKLISDLQMVINKAFPNAADMPQKYKDQLSALETQKSTITKLIDTTAAAPAESFKQYLTTLDGLKTASLKANAAQIISTAQQAVADNVTKANKAYSDLQSLLKQIDDLAAQSKSKLDGIKSAKVPEKVVLEINQLALASQKLSLQIKGLYDNVQTYITAANTANTTKDINVNPPAAYTTALAGLTTLTNNISKITLPKSTAGDPNPLILNNIKDAITYSCSYIKDAWSAANKQTNVSLRCLKPPNLTVPSTVQKQALPADTAVAPQTCNYMAYYMVGDCNTKMKIGTLSP